MVLREVLLLLLMVALVVVSTVGTVHGGGFDGRGGLGRDGGVALLLRWGSIAACRRMHGLVCLCWTVLMGRCRSAVQRRIPAVVDGVTRRRHRSVLPSLYPQVWVNAH